jgi:hypothetical protein
MMRDLNADRYGRLVACYDFPFVMHLGREIFVFNTPLEAIEDWRAFRHRLVENGHFRCALTVVAQELPRAGRFRVWAELHHEDAAGRPSGKSRMTYFFRRADRGLRLEMEHVTQRALRNPVLKSVSAVARR